MRGNLPLLLLRMHIHYSRMYYSTVYVVRVNEIGEVIMVRNYVNNGSVE